MRLVLMSEAPPRTPGMYHVKVEVYRFSQNDNYIMKDVLWWSSEGKWLISESNHTVISWVDELEPDQDVLWLEAQKIINDSSLHAYISRSAKDKLKNLFTITRK